MMNGKKKTKKWGSEERTTKNEGVIRHKTTVISAVTRVYLGMAAPTDEIQEPCTLLCVSAQVQ